MGREAGVLLAQALQQCLTRPQASRSLFKGSEQLFDLHLGRSHGRIHGLEVDLTHLRARNLIVSGAKQRKQSP